MAEMNPDKRKSGKEKGAIAAVRVNTGRVRNEPAGTGRRVPEKETFREAWCGLRVGWKNQEEECPLDSIKMTGP